MKKLYFGDHQDLPKWGVIASLRTKLQLKKVFHVALLTSEIRPRIKFDGENGTESIDPAVWDFFRNVETLGDGTIGFPIEHFAETFNRARGRKPSYLAQAIEWLGPPGRRLVFLDPDTGIAPKKSSRTLAHVRPTEIQRFWDTLARGEVLAIYQHSSRDRNWRSLKQNELAGILSVQEGQIGCAHAARANPSSAILYAKK